MALGMANGNKAWKQSLETQLGNTTWPQFWLK